MSSQAFNMRESVGGSDGPAVANVDEKRHTVGAVAAATDLVVSEDDIDAKRANSRTKSIFAVLGCVSPSFLTAP